MLAYQQKMLFGPVLSREFDSVLHTIVHNCAKIRFVILKNTRIRRRWNKRKWKNSRDVTQICSSGDFVWVLWEQNQNSFYVIISLPHCFGEEIKYVNLYVSFFALFEPEILVHLSQIWTTIWVFVSHFWFFAFFQNFNIFPMPKPIFD